MSGCVFGVARASGLRRWSMRARRAWIPFVILAFPVLPSGLFAQESASTCTSLIEAVDTVRSVGQLHGTWAQEVRQAVDPALADLIPAFARMRRYELQFHRVDSYEAATAFRRTLRRQPRLACAHYGLGRTLARGPDALIRLGERPRDYGPVPYSLAAAQAPRELRRALELDSTLVAAAAELLRLAAELRHPPIESAARELPSLVSPSFRDSPQLLLRWATLDALDGQPDSAAARLRGPGTADWSPAQKEEAARILLNAGRTDAALGLLEALGARPAASSRAGYLFARALLDTPGREEEGGAAYMRGLMQADSTALERYVQDAELLVGEGIAEWRAGGFDVLRNSLRWWWEQSAALSALTLHDRLSEHFHRLAEARRRYPLQSSLGAPGSDAVLLDPAWRRFRMDERGLVWVRQGEPERILSEDVLGVLSEAWVYPGRGGGKDIYYFRGRRNWTLVPLGCNAPRSVREVMAAYDPEIARSVMACAAPGLAGAEFDLRARQTVVDAWVTEGDRRHLDDQPSFAADFYALRGIAGTALTAVIDIGGPGLAPGGPDADPVYSSHTELILVDYSRQSVELAGTSNRTTPGRLLTASDAIRQYITADVTATSQALYRIVVTDEVNGNSSMAGGPISIPDFVTDRLQLSDLVIADADAGSWQRGDVRLSLVPGRVFTRGEPLHLYFEIYNQPPDSAFSVEVSLRANQRRGILGRIAGLFRGDRNAATIRYDDVAADVAPIFGIQQLRTVGTEDLEPGEYTLTVTITDRVSGASTTRSRSITLTEDGGSEGPGRPPG